MKYLIKTFNLFCISLLMASLISCDDDVIQEIPDPDPVEQEPVPEPEPDPDPVFDENAPEHFMIFGDIQEYTNNKVFMDYFAASMRYISMQYSGGTKISKVIFTGDITNNNLDEQWQRFWDLAEPLSHKVPIFTCVGNHDYDWETGTLHGSIIPDRNSTKLNEYTQFESSMPLIEEFFEEGKMENIVVRNEIWGERYDWLILEYGPREEVMQWAIQYVEEHSDRHFILLTHEYLSDKGELLGNWTHSTWQFEETGNSWTTPDKIWKRLVYPHDNIVLVLCGHNGMSEQYYGANVVGRIVPQIQFNLQFMENGGNGIIQVWSIPKGSNKIEVNTINTITGETIDKPNYHFFIRYR